MTIPKMGSNAYLIIVFVLGLCSSRATAEGKDIAFHAIFSSAEYVAALDRERERIEEAERLATTKMPTIGSLIVEIIPNSTAADLGLSPGSVVATIGGESVWGFFGWRDRSEPAEAIVFLPSGEEMRHTFPPNSVGVRMGPYFRPELELIRAHPGAGNPAWWKHAILGALSYADNPALSETAWAFAAREGYPEDIHSDLFAAIFAMQRPGELGPALDRFLSRFDKDEAVPLWCHGELASLLVADGRISDLARIVAFERGQHQWEAGDLAELAEAAEEAIEPRPSEDPLTYIESRPFRIINQEMVRNDELSAGRKIVVEGIFQLPLLSISRDPGFYFHNALCAENPIRNIHVRLAARRISVRGHHQNYEESMRISLISQREMRNGASSNYQGFPAREITLAGATISYLKALPGQPRTPRFIFAAGNCPGGWSTPTASHRFETRLRDGTPAYGFENLTFDLFRLGSEVFLYINRIPYIRMPIVAVEDDISVFFSCIGTTVDLDEFTIREYRP